MLSDTDGFIRLPGERILYTSPPRTTLSLQSSTFHSGTSPVAVSSNAGVAFLTNQRVSYATLQWLSHVPDHRLRVDCLSTLVACTRVPLLLGPYP